MNKKLTLLLDQDVVNNAKNYSKVHKKSLSKIVEDYFIIISSDNKTDVINSTTIVKELTGILKDSKIGNIKDEYSGYLIEKYK